MARSLPCAASHIPWNATLAAGGSLKRFAVMDVGAVDHTEAIAGQSGYSRIGVVRQHRPTPAGHVIERLAYRQARNARLNTWAVSHVGTRTADPEAVP